MMIHPDFNPIALQLGPLAIHWYGLMYLLGFIAAIILGRMRLSLPYIKERGWVAQDIDDILFYGVLGVVLGGRLGYVIFYQPAYYLSHPLDIFKVWQGGMSFHGGLIGVLFAMLIYARKHHRRWLEVMDFVAPLVPPGLAAGRLGNFINGELWGRVTNPSAWWAMGFNKAQNEDVQWLIQHPDLAKKWHLYSVFEQYHMLPRHPSELYELFLEGILLFIVLWFFSKKTRPIGAVSGLFLVGYGLVRFIAEFARQPDAFLGTLSLGLTMGQWLSLPMIVLGAGLLFFAYHRRKAS